MPACLGISAQCLKAIVEYQ